MIVLFFGGGWYWYWLYISQEIFYSTGLGIFIDFLFSPLEVKSAVVDTSRISSSNARLLVVAFSPTPAL